MTQVLLCKWLALISSLALILLGIVRLSCNAFEHQFVGRYYAHCTCVAIVSLFLGIASWWLCNVWSAASANASAHLAVPKTPTKEGGRPPATPQTSPESVAESVCTPGRPSVSSSARRGGTGNGRDVKNKHEASTRAGADSDPESPGNEPQSHYCPKMKLYIAVVIAAFIVIYLCCCTTSLGAVSVTVSAVSSLMDRLFSEAAPWSLLPEVNNSTFQNATSFPSFISTNNDQVDGRLASFTATSRQASVPLDELEAGGQSQVDVTTASGSLAGVEPFATRELGDCNAVLHRCQPFSQRQFSCFSMIFAQMPRLFRRSRKCAGMYLLQQL